MKRPASQLLLRLVVVVVPWVVVGSARLAGGESSRGLYALVLVASAFAVWRPDSPAGVVLLLGTTATWLLGTPTVTSSLSLVGAAGVIVVHLALLLAAQGPGTMPLDRAQLRLWLPRAGVAWLAAAACWLTLRMSYDEPRSSLVYGAGLLVLVVSAVVVAARIRPQNEATH